MKLSQAAAGCKGTVTKVEGSRLEVLQNEPKQPVLFYCRDSVIALAKQDCAGIELA